MMPYMRGAVMASLSATLAVGVAGASLAGQVWAASIAPPPTTTIGGVTWVQVSTPGQLEYIDQNQVSYISANIELMNDITLPNPASGTSSNWTPFGGGPSPDFGGQFNGQGYTITNVTIHDTTGYYVGFFGYADFATIENVGLISADVTGTNETGGLVGHQHSGSIKNSYVTGSVSGSGYWLGGLVGYQYGTISDSYASASVSGSGSVSGGEAIGGLVGLQVGGVLSNSYATGSVSGGEYQGGLVGVQETGTISDTYATGSVSGGEYNGGLVGKQYDLGGTINASYFDTQSGQNPGVGSGSPTGVTGESTAAMQQPSTYAGWKFTSTWGIDPTHMLNGGFPYLQWQLPPTITTTSLPAATQDSAYSQTLQATGGVPPYRWSVVSGTIPAGLTLSSSGVVSGTPTTRGSASITVQVTDAVGHAATQALTVTVQPPAPPVWTPPVLVPEPVTVNGHTTQVTGNLGYNPVLAIQQGTFAGYLEERAAITAGASFTGEGTDSAYLSAILDGSGVGLQQHVSAVQQGQFAALYQTLRIIPTWTDNIVSIPQGVAALLKAGASTLAIENYLVQLDGFGWAAAQGQAAAGFPIQSGA